MTLAIILFIIAFMVGIVLVLNKPFAQQLLIKFRGRTDEIMAQDASTPEGAKDYFRAVIREKENVYNKASQIYAETCGVLDSLKKEEYDKKREKMKLDMQINQCLDESNEEDAMELVKKRNNILSELDSLKENILETEKIMKTQEDMKEQAATQLKELKEEMDCTVRQMESDEKMIKIRQSMDNFNTNSESDRMLQKVRDGAKKTREQANGSRIAYESSIEANDRRLEKEAKNREAKATLEEFKRKRNQK